MTQLSASEVQGLEYVVLGLATCYQRDSEGRLQPIEVIEPVPASELDAIVTQGRSTSYSILSAFTYAEVVDGEQVILGADSFSQAAHLGSNFLFRLQAATRSYRVKPHYKHLPLHSTCTPEAGPFPLHYNPEPKRVLGDSAKVADGDNVKQHAHTHKQL